jgi:hypothetical protein
MADFKDRTPAGQPTPGSGSRSGGSPRAPAAPAPAARHPGGGDRSSVPGTSQDPRGRIVHDERGNAVWDWLKETSRLAIESTSRLLRKLELPELKVEDKKDEELRLESDRDSGGGYDPYNQGKAPGRKSGRKP